MKEKVRTIFQYLSFSICVGGIAAFVPSLIQDCLDPAMSRGFTWSYLVIAVVGFTVFWITASHTLRTKNLGLFALVGFAAILLPSAIVYLDQILALGIAAAFAAGFYLHSFLDEPGPAS